MARMPQGIRRGKVTVSCHWRSWLVGYALILPAMLFFLLMAAGPFFGGMYLSLFKLTIREETFIGLQNFRELISDPVFKRAFLNTLLYVVAIVPVAEGSVILLAVAVHNMTKNAKRFLRLTMYVVGMSGGAFTAGFWIWLWYPVSSGGMNTVLSRLGVMPINWFARAPTAFAVVCFNVGFFAIGSQFILALAAIDNQPVELHDAARVDGAGPWQDLIYITLPLLRRIVLYQLIIESIAVAQVWQTIMLFTSGGPDNATNSLGYLLYQKSVMQGNYGMSSAISVVEMCLILAFVAIQVRVMRDKS